MSFKLLLTAIEAGDAEKATELAKGLEGNFNDNVQEIGKLETKATEAINGRDKVKSTLRSLAEAAGVDSLTIDSLKELTSKRGDDSEIEAKYKGQLDDMATKFQAQETDYKDQLSKSGALYNNAIIDNELFKMGVSANAVSDASLEDIVKHMKNGAVIEDGKVVYVDSEGIAKRGENGRPLTLQDNIESLKNERAYLFKPQNKGGSGEAHKSGGGVDNTQSLSPAQKMQSARN